MNDIALLLTKWTVSSLCIHQGGVKKLNAAVTCSSLCSPEEGSRAQLQHEYEV